MGRVRRLVHVGEINLLLLVQPIFDVYSTPLITSNVIIIMLAELRLKLPFSEE